MPYMHVGEENSGPIEIYYEDHGHGDPVVLVHGWPLNGASWEKQVNALLETGRRVILYDRRGFGKSSQPTFGYDYQTLARDLDKILDNLDLKEVTLVGFSMGNGELAEYLRSYDTERIARVVFISPITPFLLKTADNPEGVEQNVFDGIKNALIADRPAYLSQFLANFYNTDVLGGKMVSDEVVRSSWNVAVGASPKGTLDCVSSWLTDFREHLKDIDIPALVIQGDQDRILPINATGARLAKMIPNARFEVIKDGPHGILWTHADQVNKFLLEFLENSSYLQKMASQYVKKSQEQQVRH